jgi:TPR repeat protein
MEEGQGARWLPPCKQAATKGDGHAALMVALIYWNGDGVAKDHAASAHWAAIADKAGDPRAALILGNDALGRLTKAARPEDADRAVLDEAIGWYEKALKIDPVPAEQAQARQMLVKLSGFKQKLSAR